VLQTAHGDLPTPAFMPVGTLATVKSLTPADLDQLGARCVLANTYHLTLRPGAALVARLGGLHRLMRWERPILTDSGGFQVMSLAPLREVREQGVRFASHLDGAPVELTPEGVIRTQGLLGADIIMPLDVCLPPEADRTVVEDGLGRTHRWAVRSRSAQQHPDQLLFGIVQGGLHADLRRESARGLLGLDFPGYAIGGLSVGESPATTYEMLVATTAELPADRPRYLMGVGTPEQVLEYVALGVDLFDCVLPTRLGRTGVAFLGTGRLSLRRSELGSDLRPIDPDCDCATCRRFSRAALHAGVRASQPLAARLLSIHNTRTLVRTAERARRAIRAGSFPELLVGHSTGSAEAGGSVLSAAGRGS
jgi:queuine tRNA-ribosyltransferase